MCEAHISTCAEVSVNKILMGTTPRTQGQANSKCVLRAMTCLTRTLKKVQKLKFHNNDYPIYTPGESTAQSLPCRMREIFLVARIHPERISVRSSVVIVPTFFLCKLRNVGYGKNLMIRPTVFT